MPKTLGAPNKHRSAMPKLIAQVVVGLLVWHSLGWCGAGWVLQTIAVAIGFVLVHQVWERFIFQPYDYRRACDGSRDSPRVHSRLPAAPARIVCQVPTDDILRPSGARV